MNVERHCLVDIINEMQSIFISEFSKVIDMVYNNPLPWFFKQNTLVECQNLKKKGIMRSVSFTLFFNEEGSYYFCYLK